MKSLKGAGNGNLCPRQLFEGSGNIATMTQSFG